jgi:hypothetical protein
MKIALVRPNITFFSLPKMLMMGLLVSFILGALAWFWMELLGFKYSKMIGIFAGVIWFLLACWNWWAWRPKQKNSQGRRWISGLVYVLYTGGYFWLAGTSYWANILIGTWKLVVLGCLIVLFVFVSVLPLLHPLLAKKLYMLHGKIDRKIISCGGISLIGIAGVAGYWLQKTLEKDSWTIFVSILGPIIGLGFLQYHFFEIWQTRSRANEDK